MNIEGVKGDDSHAISPQQPITYNNLGTVIQRQSVSQFKDYLKEYFYFSISLILPAPIAVEMKIFDPHEHKQMLLNILLKKTENQTVSEITKHQIKNLEQN